MPNAFASLRACLQVREGYPFVRVTPASGLKLASVYKQISQVGPGRVTLSSGSTSFADAFRHASHSKI